MPLVVLFFLTLASRLRTLKLAGSEQQYGPYTSNQGHLLTSSHKKWAFTVKVQHILCFSYNSIQTAARFFISCPPSEFRGSSDSREQTHAHPLSLCSKVTFFLWSLLFSPIFSSPHCAAALTRRDTCTPERGQLLIFVEGLLLPPRCPCCACTPGANAHTRSGGVVCMIAWSHINAVAPAPWGSCGRA